MLISELEFKTSRSSGSGGQHVNKVSSKVKLIYDLFNSKAFSDDKKDRLIMKLEDRLTRSGKLVLNCDQTRSQHRNKEIVITRLLDLLKEALVEEKKRIKTKVPKGSKRKRLEDKRKHAQKKKGRQPPELS